MMREGREIKNKKNGALIIMDEVEWWEKEGKQRIINK